MQISPQVICLHFGFSDTNRGTNPYKRLENEKNDHNWSVVAHSHGMQK